MQTSMLSLLKLSLVLALTIFLLLRKWDLGGVLLLNAVLVAVLFAYPAVDLLRSIGAGLIAADTLTLAGAVFLVLLLAELMRRTHAMELMAHTLLRMVPDSRIVLALIPLTIGLMPMLGGAMVSAPMVNEIGARLRISPERKTFINYWFRHTMEYVFPLYSSLLMMAALLSVSVYEFIAVSWPLSLVALIGGGLWGLWGIEAQESTRQRVSFRVWRDLLESIWPLLLVLLLVVVLRLNMLLMLAGVSLLYAALKRIGPRQWPDVLRRSFPIHTFSAIFGVMIFKQVLQDAGAVELIPAALEALGLPPLLVALAVSMLVGLLTGTAAAALALSVPLVTPLMVAQSMDPLLAGLWLFVGGFGGVLLSPLHLCLALTREYFRASWAGLYKAIIPAVTLMILVALGLVLLR